MNLATFRVQFPEFKTAPDAFVQGKLDVAALELYSPDLDVSFDQAHGLLAAHKLAISPFGTSARVLKSGQTTYEVELANVFSRRLLGVVTT